MLGTPDALSMSTAECPPLLGAERVFEGGVALSDAGSNGVQSQDTLSRLD
jgi:hypothetical protein